MAKRIHNVPVLILGYKRYSQILEIGSVLAESDPCCVYLSIDGPSSDNRKELGNLFKEFRSLFPTVETKCVARDSNLGIAKHLKTAGDEVSSIHESFIVLEDDCLPARGFYSFLRTALEIHKDNPRIGMVTANNLNTKKTSIRFAEISDFPLTWGWGTFKGVWERFDPELSNLTERDVRRGIKRVHKSFLVRRHWVKRTRESLGDRQMWDAQWTAYLWALDLKTINPSVELVSNVGMDKQATHTKSYSLLLETEITEASKLIWDEGMVSSPRPWSAARRRRHFMVLRLESLQMLLQNLGFLLPYKLFLRLIR